MAQWVHILILGLTIGIVITFAMSAFLGVGRVIFLLIPINIAMGMIGAIAADWIYQRLNARNS